MADIELVIRIPEEDFERCKKRFQMRIDIMGDAIANGTPLPKGHGRLIDAGALKMNTRVCGDRYLSKTSLFVTNQDIEQATTIIEADTTESEE